MTSVAHIINPVKVSENSDFFRSQQITFESLKRAKEFSRFKENIRLYAVGFAEDEVFIPADFSVLSNLTKSSKDRFPNPDLKKLPFIDEILRKTQEETFEDFILYSNMDISVMPYFYDSILNYIHKGYDAVVINRRRLSKNYLERNEITEMYADLGKSHPGFDCFLFHRDLLDKLILEDVLVGVPFLETALLHNLFSLAENPLFIPDAHLTFHLGMDVLNFPRNELYYHNRKTFFKQIQPKLKPHYSIQKFPYATLPFPKRVLKWGLNPSLFIRNSFELEGKGVLRKTKSLLDELRWRILQR